MTRMYAHPATSKPSVVETPPVEKSPPGKKKGDAQAVQREPASPTTALGLYDTSAVSLVSRRVGHRLDDDVRHMRESRFGCDFSQVRIHDDTDANAAAASVDAKAFTVGSHVVFAAGQPSPSTLGGRRLLAHELAHVVQQTGSERRLQRKASGDGPHISNPSDPAERQADEVAERVVAGLPAFASAAAQLDQIGRESDDDAGRTGDADGVDTEGDVSPPLEDDPWPDDSSAEGEQPAREEVQASRDHGPGTAPPGFRAALARTSGGSPIPAAAHSALTRSFGRSFGDVRLHRGDDADALTAAIGARAFTWGSDVYLGRAAARLDGSAGLRLLAHELAHVVQGSSTPASDRIHRTRLYFSTMGRQGYFRYAERFHRDHGFPAPLQVSSVEELLENLVTLSRPIESIRLVTHAVPAGIFLPLLRGGSTSLFEQDLALQSQGRLESELSTEHPTVGRQNQPRTLEHHVVSRRWATDIYTRLASDQSWPQSRDSNHLPRSVTAGGDLESLLWWIMDREVLAAERPATGRGGRPIGNRPIIAMPAATRARVIASLNRNIGIYKSLAVDHLVSSADPRSGIQNQRRAQAEMVVAELEQRVVQAAGPMIAAEAASGGLSQIQYADPSDRYGSVQGALERGTYSNNLLTAKTMLPDGMPFEIRGCRIGQNVGWLEKFRDYWGFGVGGPPGGRRPDLSAPNLRHVFGLRAIREGRRVRRESAEWLEGRRGRHIYGGTAEFEQHIVHAR